MDLAAVLLAAIEANRERINAAADRHAEQPVEVQFHWHPQMGKVETVIRPSDRLPTFRIDRAA